MMLAGADITLGISLSLLPQSLPPTIMRNYIFTTGLAVTFLFFGTIAPSAIASTVNAVEPNNGFLEQPAPIFMNAAPIPASLYPTLTQEIRAANLLVHQTDTLPIGSPEYKNAHRLLISNLRMLQRQLSFSPADLAKFNSETHPPRSTADQSNYSPDGTTGTSKTAADTSAATFFPNDTVFSANVLFDHTYTGNAPSRRSVVAFVDEQNALRALAAMQ
jgi:hypothetical protein